MDTFTIILQLISIILIIAAFAVGIIPWLRVASARTQPENIPEDGDAGKAENDRKLPKVSVVVYSAADSSDVPQFLDTLLQQDYPNFEIVVVHDASAEATAILAEQFEDKQNITVTFVPPGSRNVSRRKLANTIGMKTANGDVVLFTDTNAVIPSLQWIRLMTSEFTDPALDIMLGYTHIDFSELRGIRRWYRQFDSVYSDSEWISSALVGKAWRGDRYNIAIRKKTFFAHKGYASTVNLHDGDDDLFVYEVADTGRVGMMLCPDSILTMQWGHNADRILTNRKERRDFTQRWLPKSPRLRAGFLSLCQWLVPVLCVVSVLYGTFSWIGISLATTILMLFWIVEILAYRKLAVKLHATRLWWSLPLFMLWHPVGNAIFRLEHMPRRFKNFTWQRHK